MPLNFQSLTKFEPSLAGKLPFSQWDQKKNGYQPARR
jgi:hypothetical protein